MSGLFFLAFGFIALITLLMMVKVYVENGDKLFNWNVCCMILGITMCILGAGNTLTRAQISSQIFKDKEICEAKLEVGCEQAYTRELYIKGYDRDSE